MSDRLSAFDFVAPQSVASPEAALKLSHGSQQHWRASGLKALLGRADLPRLSEVVALRPLTRVLIAGLSGWIFLVTLVTIATIALMEISTVHLAEWLRLPISADSSAAARPPANFEAIVQRPLFARNRQATAQAAVPVLAAVPTTLMPDQDVTLKGVFLSGSTAKAFLLSSQDPLGHWVQADEEIAGWKVVSIHRDQVILQGQGERRMVPLHAGSTK